MLKIENGSFNIQQNLLNPGKFSDWILCCSNATR
jgi:hypothetical protein